MWDDGRWLRRGRGDTTQRKLGLSRHTVSATCWTSHARAELTRLPHCGCARSFPGQEVAREALGCSGGPCL